MPVAPAPRSSTALEVTAPAADDDGTEPVCHHPKMPWDEPGRVLLIAREKMTPDDFVLLLKQAAKMVEDI
jgi:hypothetical protein